MREKGRVCETERGEGEREREGESKRERVTVSKWRKVREDERGMIT